MNPHPDTPSRFLAVPGHTRLFRREPGGTYYLRAKVPLPLRSIIGKTEIRKSLDTKDYKRGLLLVKPESMRVDRLFMSAEEKLKGVKPADAKLSRQEVAWFVSDWFVKQESLTDQWLNEELPRLTDDERENVLDSLKAETDALGSHHPYADARSCLDEFLSGDGQHMRIEKDSEDYKRLLPLFREAQSEILSRKIDRISGEGHTAYNPRFKNLYANTLLQPPPKEQVELGRFLDDFMAYQRRVHSETTPAVYALAVRIIREVIGEKTLLHSITRRHLEKVCDVLCRVPLNMTQRYRGLTAEDAIRAAERANDTRKLASRTLRNNYILILAIFNYAVADQLMAENPAKARKLSELFKVNAKPKAKRSLFTPEELQKIFSAPLYTGCQDDETGYAKPGTERPRRGRFWVPLVAIFSGLRCNEACQLYTSDIGEENGVPYLHVRADSDDEGKTDKRVKNSASWRKVPIHSELLKIGFLEYVERIRRNKESQRLFPTLEACKSTGRYSKPFSKWFSRFVELACGSKPQGVFHSFRHHFRTALMRAGVQPEFVEALGGWKPEGSSEIEYRHAEMPELRAAVEKISYPGLDLSHLY